jgi:hypothetical protein
LKEADILKMQAKIDDLEETKISFEKEMSKKLI